MSARIRVAILFGGRSAEHDVSIMSATNVISAIDQNRYDVVPIKVTREGKWLLSDTVSAELGSAHETEVALLPGGRGRMLAKRPDGSFNELSPVDVLFPVLHGPFGEDGSVQGYAEVADIPNVGCGIMASAAAMDKDIAKRLLRQAGISVAPSVTVEKEDKIDASAILQTLGSPLFVKPCSQGSSFGVSKVSDVSMLRKALDEAFRYGDKALIEAFVEAREIECAVLEDQNRVLTVSAPGEIIPAASHGFYSYDAKYTDADGALVKIPADLEPAVAEKARRMAERGFRALGCEGMARVDFFLRANGDLLINEINTLPGFTNISMYPKAMAASGIAGGPLVSMLIEHALERYRRRA
ncbi:D-alanine--D-alanine ligase family protein [Rhizobium sp. RAF56]|uniref:D-alanine--D-alanine ligase family protein n=1 Tax=Rhizobium sp. RAF56 TaxID=3233062 RepID=UPI003F9986C5